MRRGDILLDFMMREVARADAADAVILSTFDELEPAALDAMRAVLPAPVYTIGPLGLLLERLAADADAAALAVVRASLCGRRTRPASGGWTVGRRGPWCT